MKVLLIDDVHEVLTIGLLQAGWEVDYQPNLKKEEFLHALKASQPNGVVVRSKLNMKSTHLDEMKRVGVEWIARAGAGVDNIDVEYASRIGIKLIHAVGANADSVAEHMVGMLLSLRHNLYRSHAEVLQFQWNREKNRGVEIHGKTLGIIGYGQTGSKLAQKLSGFGMKILAYDKYHPVLNENTTQDGGHLPGSNRLSNEDEHGLKQSKFGVESNHDVNGNLISQKNPKSHTEEVRFTNQVKGVELEVLKRESDIISFHVPLTDETRNWVNDDFLEGCKPGLVLLNGSRGEVVQLKSVLKHLENNKLSGFAADVLEVEPPSKMDDHTREIFEKLGTFSNVMFSPHIAGWSVESYRQISEYLLRKIMKYNKMS